MTNGNEVISGNDFNTNRMLLLVLFKSTKVFSIVLIVEVDKKQKVYNSITSFNIQV